MTVFEKLIQVKNKKGAGYLVLIDPDKMPFENISHFLQKSIQAEIDGLLIGGSLILNTEFQKFVTEVKKYAKEIPVILFPGSVHQVTEEADALLFLSLISGREAQHLIGSHVLAAPLIHKIDLETISTAYMIVDSGKQTSAQFMSGTIPLPRNKPEIVVAHALAAQYLGFKFIYLEGGSGAEYSIPPEIISAVSKVITLPILVGGGICTPSDAAEKVRAGASFVVTGNILETSDENNLLTKFSKAIHCKI